jgi:hypothetical protein
MHAIVDPFIETMVTSIKKGEVSIPPQSKVSELPAGFPETFPFPSNTLHLREYSWEQFWFHCSRIYQENILYGFSWAF